MNPETAVTCTCGHFNQVVFAVCMSHITWFKISTNLTALPTKENGGSFLVLVSIELLRSQMLAKWKTYNNVLVTSTFIWWF